MFGCKLIDVNALSARPARAPVQRHARRSNDSHVHPVPTPHDKTQYGH
ncbi:hypothetical protein QFZ97_008865 [Paraburkholderia youngii]